MNQKSPQLLKTHLLIVFLMAFLSCTPPKSLFKIEGSPTLIRKINTIIESAGIDLNMGIKIVSLNDDKTLYAYNSQKLLMPASTNKLYTCAAALHFLKNDYKFQTKILKNNKNVILKGGGDPDLKIEKLDSLAMIVSKNISKIDTLFFDDTMIDSMNYGEGWMWDEGPWWYAAPIGGLSVNDNCIDFYVKPGKLGNACKIDYYPKTSYIKIENHSRTVNDTIDFQKLKIERDWVSNKIFSQLQARF